MNELQQAEFNILRYFNQFAKDNDISYFLYAGTLLGSIRHQGFIPWDDDIDIGLLRNEFEKFEKKFINSNYEKNGYIYQTRKIFSFQASEVSKIRSKELNMKERMPKTQKGNYGPWIDIFAFDNIPDDEKERRKQYKKITFYNNLIKKTLMIQVEPNDKGIKKWLKKIVQWTNETFYEKYFFLPYIFQKRYKWMTKYNNIETTHAADISYMYYKDFNDFSKRFFKKEDLNNLALGTFEGEKFPIPVKYDDILTIHYGDYMTLPKKDEQKVHKIEYIMNK